MYLVLTCLQSLTKSNWRRKHEEFINNIRAAKQAQQHVARGGKLKDLPPPPPLDTSDYIQCPHCGRRFNESAAERHIPKCATMLHNKPKPSGAGGKPTVGGAKTKTTAQTRRNWIYNAVILEIHWIEVFTLCFINGWRHTSCLT